MGIYDNGGLHVSTDRCIKEQLRITDGPNEADFLERDPRTFNLVYPLRVDSVPQTNGFSFVSVKRCF